MAPAEAGCRALEESAALSRKLEAGARERHVAGAAGQFARRADEREKHAAAVRKLLE